MLKTIGEILENGKVVPGKLIDGYCYKNYTNFCTKKGICYIPEGEFEDFDEVDLKNCKTYDYDSLLKLCTGNESLVYRLFSQLSWEYPEGALEQLDGVEECPKCHFLYDNEESDVCPKCNK